MRPVHTARSNFVWTGPSGSTDVGDLHAHVNREAGETESVWELTPTERERIAAGANVLLTVWGRHPPVSVAVTDQQGDGEDSAENAAACASGRR